MKGDLTRLSAVDAAENIRAGRLSSEALTAACLMRIDETENAIKAWAHVQPEQALAQAREADRIRKSGRAIGPLHGVPVGLKDIIDTSDMPTARGSAIFDGRQPETDATLVERLREAGAVIMGKTKTTELAFVHPTDTTNPHDATRTPGGSSSGSAAAVAARHVPLAIGTQTNGSVIRPASFCGVFGFKPTNGVVSRHGLLQTSVSLDQVGGFGRSIQDVALLIDAIGSYDQRDSLSFARPRPRMLTGARADAPVKPDIAWFDLPINDQLDADAREGIDAVIDALGPRIHRFDAAEQFSDLISVQQTIHQYEICQHQAKVFTDHWDLISPALQAIVEQGRAITKDQYEDAIAVKSSADTFFADFFNDFDAILAPSATGQAPLISAGGTGNPIFCTIWTLAGLPSLSMPLLVGENDLPIGVQLIGAKEEDDRLLRTASWVQTALMAQD
ncbi:MAG: Asp-tRNA(Asn)/Glu-tRNA(Gln) amidotransferase A subunit family amidase [Paracoccaceae bacterium]|jgi:Asp-tRNA(Asn)/Glu-tRNA(Gln) amidotransferase A subunit family amidase